MLIPNGVSEDFPGYFMSKNVPINKSNSRKTFGKKWFQEANGTGNFTKKLKFFNFIQDLSN